MISSSGIQLNDKWYPWYPALWYFLQYTIDIHHYDIFNVSRSLEWLQLLRVHWTSCSQTLKIKRFHNFLFCEFSNTWLSHTLPPGITSKHCKFRGFKIFWVNFQAHDCHPLYHQACDIPAHEAFLEKFGRVLHHNHVYIIRAKYWIKNIALQHKPSKRKPSNTSLARHSFGKHSLQNIAWSVLFSFEQNYSY